MEFRLLGPMECLVAGRPVALGRPQERCVLAVLLLNVGRVVPLSRLVEVLWESRPPERARSIVHTHVARLRATLRAAGAGEHGVQIATFGQGYLIEAPELTVDAHRFRHLVRQARDTTDPLARAAALDDALSLWRGAALADVASEAIRKQLCAGLIELRLSALEDKAEAELATGRHRDLVIELTDLAARHPLRERLVGLLMLALYRSGQQAAALALYRDTRRRLVEELGIEPAAELRRLERSILSQDVTLDGPPAAPPAVQEPPAPEPVTWRGPRSHLTSIVGREREFAALSGRLADHRLVTVVGVGGVGKTTLALHVAEAAAGQLRRDVLVVALAPLRTHEEVVLAISALLGLGGATVTDSLTAIEQRLATRPHLLVLDNCEHLAAECAEVVRALLAASARLVVLATSRAPLGLSEETVWPLDPLALPAAGTAPDADTPAVALFLRRAAEARPGFTHGPAELAAVGRICRRLDGHPLALELAASRLRVLSTEQLADALDSGPGLLARSDVDNPLTTTLDWSYTLLGETERRLLARLSVFRGGFDTTTAEQVCGASPLSPDAVLPALVTLADKSLVQVYDVAGVRRFRLLEVVRDYAASRLATMDEPESVADRQLDHWLTTTRAITTLPYMSEQQIAGWVALRADQDNLRTAAEHGYASGRTEDAIELTNLLFDYWAMQDIGYAEMERWFDRAAPYLASCPPGLRGLTRFHRSILRTTHDDYASALVIKRQALPDLLDQPTTYQETTTSIVRGQTRVLDPAAPAAATALYPTLAAPHARQHGAAMLAEALVVWGRYAEAIRLCAEWEPIEQTCAVVNSIRLLVNTCLAALGRGDLGTAEDAERRLRTEVRRPGNTLHPATARYATAMHALVTLPPRDAGAVLDTVVRDLDARQAPTVSRAYGFRILAAEAHRRAGRVDQALRHLTDGLATGRTSSDFTRSIPGVLGAALLAADLGDRATSVDLARSWDRVRRGLGLPAPLGFAGPVADVLGLDPAAPTGPPPADAWNLEDLTDLVVRAHRWCQTANTQALSVGS